MIVLTIVMIMIFSSKMMMIIIIIAPIMMMMMMTLNITVIVRSNPGLIIEQALLRAARGPDCLWQRVCSSTCTAMMIMRMRLMMMIFVIIMMITMIVICYIFLLINLDHNTFYKFVQRDSDFRFKTGFPQLL